jgi:hypothetical protein
MARQMLLFAFVHLVENLLITRSPSVVIKKYMRLDAKSEVLFAKTVESA